MNARLRLGFTIIELVIVISVIAIIAAILIPTFDGVIDNAEKVNITQEIRDLYMDYFVNNPVDASKYANLLYYKEDGCIFTIKNGIVADEYFSSEAEALASLVDVPDGYRVLTTEERGFLAVVSKSEIPESKWKGTSALAVGDEITYREAGCDYLLYFNHLINDLSLLRCDSQGKPFSCISASSDYENDTHHLINRFNDLSERKLILVFMGMNDYLYNTPIGNIEDADDISLYGALNTIIPGILEKKPGSRLVFVTPMPIYMESGQSTNAVGHSIKDYAEAIKRACEKYDVDVIDLYSLFPLDPMHKQVRDNYMPDGIHPNEEGHRLIARIIESGLSDISLPSVDPESNYIRTGKMTFGNRFSSDSEKDNIICSVDNIFLSYGMMINVKNDEIYNVTLVKTDSILSSNVISEINVSNNSEFLIDESGWYGLVIESKNGKAFDLESKDMLLDYISFSMRIKYDYQWYTTEFKINLPSGTLIRIKSDTTQWHYNNNDAIDLNESGWIKNDYVIKNDGYYGFTLNVSNDKEFVNDLFHYLYISGYSSE